LIFLEVFADGFASFFRLISTTDFIYTLGQITGAIVSILGSMVVISVIVAILLAKLISDPDKVVRDKIVKNVREYSDE
jgi:hypothetical protein